jgi:hypothetical protein
VEKKGSSDRRVILDLSFPPEKSVNGGIPKRSHEEDDCRISYCSVDDLVELVKHKGQGCLLFKRDLKRAYRQIPIDPGDIHLFGWQWNGSIYIDRVLAMGLRSAAIMCQRLTDAISYLMKKRNYSVVNYLDDFGGCDSVDRAWDAYETLGHILEDAGRILRESM